MGCRVVGTVDNYNMVSRKLARSRYGIITHFMETEKHLYILSLTEVLSICSHIPFTINGLVNLTSYQYPSSKEYVCRINFSKAGALIDTFKTDPDNSKCIHIITEDQTGNPGQAYTLTATGPDRLFLKYRD
jgi:hypothetical protein